MEVIDLQRAAPSGRVPVDVPHPVARPKGTNLGELDAIAARPRQLVAGVDLGLGRSDEGPQDLGAWVYADPQGLVKRTLLRVQPQGIAPAQPHMTNVVEAPANPSDPERRGGRIPVGARAG